MDTLSTAPAAGAPSKVAAPAVDAAATIDFLQMLALCLQSDTAAPTPSAEAAVAASGAAMAGLPCPESGTDSGSADDAAGEGGDDPLSPEAGMALLFAELALPAMVASPANAAPLTLPASPVTFAGSAATRPFPGAATAEVGDGATASAACDATADGTRRAPVETVRALAAEGVGSGPVPVLHPAVEGQGAAAPASGDAAAAIAATASYVPISHAGPVASPAPGAAEPHLPRTVHTPVGAAGWPGELGEEVLLLTGEGRQSASIRLSPEHLGPLEVRIAVRDGETTVYFGAAQAETRAALEQALPRLRELLASQGLLLADAGVFRDAPRDPPRATSAAGTGGDGERAGRRDEQEARVLRAAGLVDVYA